MSSTMNTLTKLNKDSTMIKMKKSAISCVLFVFCITGCSSDVDEQVKKINDREYEITISRGREPILKAECNYLGSEPIDLEKFRQHFSHNFEAKKTDFYSVTMENLSSQAIHVIRADYDMRTGSYRGKSTFSSNEFAMTWESSVIEPGMQIRRDTHFVWAINDNVLDKTLRMLGRSENGEDFEFTIVLPFRFHR